MHAYLTRSSQLAVLLLFFMCCPSADAQESSDEIETSIRQQIDELLEEQAQIQAKIDSLRSQLEVDDSSTIPDEATKAAGNAKLHHLNEWIEVGDIRVRLIRFSNDNRNLSIEKQLDFTDSGPITADIALYGALVEVQNRSGGRVAQPFNAGNMFFSTAQLHAIDNWGNKLKEASLQSSEYTVSPGPSASFVIEDHKVMPQTTETFLLAIDEPDVTTIDWLVVQLSINTPDGTHKSWFYVPADKINNLGKDL